MYLSPSLSLSLCLFISLYSSVCLSPSLYILLPLSLSLWNSFFVFGSWFSVFFCHKKFEKRFGSKKLSSSFKIEKRDKWIYRLMRFEKRKIATTCHDEISQFKSEQFNGISWSTTAIAPTDSISFVFISSPGIKLAKLLLHSS